MQTKVLLSIKPQFAERIFNGSKRYEFRRVLFRSTSVTTVVVYASSPIKRVIGEFTVGGILRLRKQALWRKTKNHAGIEKRHFDLYFAGRRTAFAIKVSRPERYPNPISLDSAFAFERPPQSFRYLI
jgi:predicted transcriptional regulator